MGIQRSVLQGSVSCDHMAVTCIVYLKSRRIEVLVCAHARVGERERGRERFALHNRIRFVVILGNRVELWMG